MNANEITVAISGNTYPVKEQLKALGARWNADEKCWMVAESQAIRAREIVAGAGQKKSYSGASRYGSYATIGQRQNERMASTGWTGCSCGSIEGRPRSSDCSQCQHDY